VANDLNTNLIRAKTDRIDAEPADIVSLRQPCGAQSHQLLASELVSGGKGRR
jgi:hypothetical protein